MAKLPEELQARGYLAGLLVSCPANNWPGYLAASPGAATIAGGTAVLGAHAYRELAERRR
jgi:hypothetical protein